MARFLTILSTLFATIAAEAAVIGGQLLDSISGEPLAQASVRLLARRDSALVRGAMSDDNGRFSIANVADGRYIVEASYVGYATQYRNIRVNGDRTLPAFRMAENAIALREATVIGVRTPIKVMQDTIEFNAEAYHTQPNAVVEDLLRRLPGVEVGSDGKITANGKEVKKILVDGKEFFSDDPTVASRNLPVDMVDKLQVVDRRSDLARLTCVDDGDDETVINLTVKKDRQNGWFGNIVGGYGTDDRYRANFTINRFWNGNQLTFLGAANNINEPGFADGGGRFRRFGGVNGIKSSQAFGVNFNIGNDEIFRVGGDVMYSHSDQHTVNASERMYLFADSTSTSRTGKDTRDRGHNFRADFRMVWKPDSFSTLEIRPNISLNYNKSYSTDSTLTYAGDAARTPVSRSMGRNRSDGSSVEVGARLTFNHNFRSKPGRSFSVFANYRMSNIRENDYSYSLNRFFLLGDSVDLYDQYADNHTWSNSISSRLSWTEPIGKTGSGHFLTFAYQLTYRWNNADRMTYDHPVTWTDGSDGEPSTGADLIFNADLSNSFRNDFFSQDIRVGYRRVTKKANFNIGISLVPQTSKSLNLINSDKTIPLRRVFNVAPFLRYRYRFTRTRNIAADYRGRSSQPSMTQLQPVPDRSDPLRVVVGNPALNPTFTHNVNVRFHDFNPEAQRAIMLMIMGNYVQNSIVSNTVFDPETGGQTTTYENVQGVWSARLMNMISLPLRNRAFTINNHLHLSYSNNVGFNNALRNRSGSFNVNESFGIAWRPENLEFELRPNYGFQTTSNTVQKGADRRVHTYGGTFYATYTTPVGIVLSTDVNYAATSGYANGYDTRTWMWNAEVSYQFLKGRNAAVSLKAYDILGQRSNVTRTVTANYIDDNRYNSLTRYVMLSVSYRFNTFGQGNEPAARRRGHYGPPPGAGRGGRPPGPHPGM